MKSTSVGVLQAKRGKKGNGGRWASMVCYARPHRGIGRNGNAGMGGTQGLMDVYDAAASPPKVQMMMVVPEHQVRGPVSSDKAIKGISQGSDTGSQFELLFPTRFLSGRPRCSNGYRPTLSHILNREM